MRFRLSWARLSNLTDLWLSSNQLTGEIPLELGRLSNLTELALFDNQLTGEIPLELGRLSNLTGLFLAPQPVDRVHTRGVARYSAE